MRWQGERESENVEDRRGRGSVPMKAGAMGGGALILVIIAMLFGLDPSKLLSGLGGGGTPAAAAGEERQLTPQEIELKKFVAVVLGSTEDVWNKVLNARGSSYREPTLTLFSGAVATACGTQSSQVGPFYCPGDQHVYLDTDFFITMKNRLGAPGDFAQAYVIAHEVGHHVQNLLGYSEKVHALHGRVSQEEYNRASVRLELQADFLAGVWAHHAQKLRNILEAGDIEEAMGAAAAVGDDKLQREATGTVRPETFTHGTSKQRMQAFDLGLRTGDIQRAAEFFQ
ncbi:MAG: neutral zinc metallopeptidase [Planctomycetota bacterium]